MPYRQLFRTRNYRKSHRRLPSLDFLRNISQSEKTARGFDGIPAWVLSKNAHYLAPSIQHIYNLAHRSGAFPKAFKISKIVPLAKVLQPNSLDQLRPKSITPVLSRHFERLVYTKFIKNNYKSSLKIINPVSKLIILTLYVSSRWTCPKLSKECPIFL